MNAQEVTLVLAKIQAYDGRNVAQSNVAAWAEALADTRVDDALAAVAEHFATETTWMMPAHVLKIAKDWRFRALQRVKEHGEPDYPPELNWNQERAYRRQYVANLMKHDDRDKAHADTDEWICFPREYPAPGEPSLTRDHVAQIRAYRANTPILGDGLTVQERIRKIRENSPWPARIDNDENY